MATKQLTISDLAESLNKQEIESGKRHKSQAKNGKDQLKVLTSLNENFSQYFQVQQKQSLDEAEAKRDAKQKSKSKKDDLPMFSDMVKGVKGKGFLAIIAAVGASIAGLVVGIFDGIKELLKFLTPEKLKKWFNVKVVGKITGMFDAVGEVFRKAGTGQFLTKSTKETLGKFTGKLQDLAKSLKKPIGVLENARSMLFYFFTTIGKVLKWVALLPLNILIKTKDGALRAFDKLAGFFKSIKSSISGFLKKSSVITDQIDNIKNVFGQFFSFGKKSKEVGESAKKGSKIFSMIGGMLKPFFALFRGFGKILGFFSGPVGIIIFAIIDGLMGAVKGFKRTSGGIVQKLIGAVLGVAAGILSGFFGGILDFFKFIIGFTAGLFGLDKVKTFLSSFSFADLFYDVLMSPFHFIMDTFEAIDKTIAGAFAAFNKDGMTGLKTYFFETLDKIWEGIKNIFSGFLSWFKGDGPEDPVNLTAKSRASRSRVSKQTFEQAAANVGSRGASARRLEERRKSKEDAAMKAQTASNVLIQDNSTNTSSSGGGQQQTAVLPGTSMSYDIFDHGTRTA